MDLEAISGGARTNVQPAARSLPRRRNFWNIQIASQIGTMDLEAATSGARADIPSRVQGHYLVAGTYGHPER